MRFFFNRAPTDLETGPKCRNPSTIPQVSSTPRSVDSNTNDKESYSPSSTETKLLQELLEKFDPKAVGVPALLPVSGLKSYANAVRDYEWWLGSTIQNLEPDAAGFPPTFPTYGRNFAILECAKHHSSSLSPAEKAVLASFSASCAKIHVAWSLPNLAYHRTICEEHKNASSQRKSLIGRMLMATFSGLTLIIPMLIMVLDQARITTLVTTSAFTLAIGLALAWWMDEAHSHDIIMATAGYAAVLVVFVGTSGDNRWMERAIN
ncbi:hypothetical protein LSUE1_G001242 [Lachnellula suecica]|uniref:DUF6594 domain-containing protein n=1 Tax=Lachnellula suecica TaxID=602035 RepID=A0A8T9CCF6_9HELO|nr:hypothetical protein LSUE1_G001242 [Lachnellula suecica]